MHLEEELNLTFVVFLPKVQSKPTHEETLDELKLRYIFHNILYSLEVSVSWNTKTWLRELFQIRY